jgi:RNA polymerase sigma-70 factor (ECF subfamily)
LAPLRAPLILQRTLLYMNRRDKHADYSDQELLDNFYKDGNTEWLGILLPRYTLLLLGVCMKYLKNEEEAKDCVQQVFLKAITELGKYRVEYFKAWIYMVAKNHCLMRIRDKQGKRAIEITENHVASADDFLEGNIHLEKDVLLTRMAAALEELNKEQKQCIILFYLEKRSYHEIAEITGYTLMQVKSYIQNGKRNMKIMLEKNMKTGK